MMEYFKLPKKTTIVSEKGGPPPPSSTPCQDTGEKINSPPLVGGYREVPKSRTPPTESRVKNNENVRFGMSSGPVSDTLPRDEIRDGLGFNSTADVHTKYPSKISSKIDFFKNLEKTRNSDKQHKISLGPDGLTRGMDQLDERRRDIC